MLNVDSVFMKIDTDKSGYLERDEIFNVFTHYMSTADAKIKTEEIFNLIDFDKNNRID